VISRAWSWILLGGFLSGRAVLRRLRQPEFAVTDASITRA